MVDRFGLAIGGRRPVADGPPPRDRPAVCEQRFDQRRLARMVRSGDGDIPKARDVFHSAALLLSRKVAEASPATGRFLPRPERSVAHADDAPHHARPLRRRPRRRGRFRPLRRRLRPGDGGARATRRVRERGRGRRRRASGAHGVPGMVGDAAAAAGRGAVPLSRAAAARRRPHRRADHRRARQDARRRARRGAARARGRGVRLRDPAPAQRRRHRERRARGGQLRGAPAARGVRWDHAVQLPGDGADVDVPDRARVRQYVRAQAERERSVTGARAREIAAAKRVCRTASSTSSTAIAKRWTRCSNTRQVAAISFVGSTPIAEYVYRPGRATASAFRRWAARRTISS